MSTNKQTFAFDLLKEQMETLNIEQQRTYMGGLSTGVNTDEPIWGRDPEGNWYYKFAEGDDWTSYASLEEVEIISEGGGFGYGYENTFLYWYDEYNASSGYDFESDPFGSSGSSGWNDEYWDSTGASGYENPWLGYNNIYTVGGGNANTGNYNIPNTGGTPGSISDTMSGYLKDIWNSDTMRALVPDLVSINISTSFIPGIGSSNTISINLVTRGHGSLSATFTGALKAGLAADASYNLSIGNFLGNAENANLDALLGSGYEGSVDLGEYGAGGWVSVDSDGIPTWVGASIGAGLGGGWSAGATETFILMVDGVPLRWDF